VFSISKTIALILLVLLVMKSIFAFRRDKRQYKSFQSVTDSPKRQEFYKKWTIEPFFMYGMVSILLLFLIGHFPSLFQMPDFLQNVSESITNLSHNSENRFIAGMLKGLLAVIVPLLIVGTPVITLIGTYREFKTQDDKTDRIAESRNIQQLIPRNYKERIWGFFLSLNAGFSEELFFRLLIPILIYAVSGSAIAAILLATLWFGLAHYYQGLSGIIATSIAGLILFLVYLISQSIWIAILAHAIIDLNGLVLAPWFKEYLKKN